MNLRKYISRKGILRFLAIFTVVLSAALFDALHAGSEELVDETHQRSESQFMHSNHVFFYNPINYFKIRKGTDKLFSGLLFAATQNEFLTKYHNCRTYHLLKAESFKERLPLVRIIHFMEFNPCHPSGPDDHPSVV
jgi:hypothetical protein